jgi:hypothetical protein
VPEFVAHPYGLGDATESTSVVLLSTDDPEYVAEALLGVTSEDPPG